MNDATILIPASIALAIHVGIFLAASTLRRAQPWAIGLTEVIWACLSGWLIGALGATYSGNPADAYGPPADDAFLSKFPLWLGLWTMPIVLLAVYPVQVGFARRAPKSLIERTTMSSRGQRIALMAAFFFASVIAGFR